VGALRAPGSRATSDASGSSIQLGQVQRWVLGIGISTAQPQPYLWQMKRRVSRDPGAYHADAEVSNPTWQMQRQVARGLWEPRRRCRGGSQGGSGGTQGEIGTQRHITHVQEHHTSATLAWRGFLVRSDAEAACCWCSHPLLANSQAALSQYVLASHTVRVLVDTTCLLQRFDASHVVATSVDCGVHTVVILHAAGPSVRPV
jgi:hypothetical protein